MIRVLFIGDVFGSPGREAVRKCVPRLRAEMAIDAVVANCENAAHGKGVSKKIARELLAASVDLLTSGNHVWQSQDIYPYLDDPASRLLRPANFPAECPGRGRAVLPLKNGIKLGVMNIIGRNQMPQHVDHPFKAVDREIAGLNGLTDVILLDMHAETTAESRAMGWYVDGRVQACLGTHTHVQTADEEILPQGTAYITDVGMTGPYDSVIGMKKEVALKKMITSMPHKFEVASGDVRFCACVVEMDEKAGRATKIQRVCERL